MIGHVEVSWQLPGAMTEIFLLVLCLAVDALFVAVLQPSADVPGFTIRVAFGVITPAFDAYTTTGDSECP